jgi:D-sedoheptulose 7-phosphate isomerase
MNAILERIGRDHRLAVEGFLAQQGSALEALATHCVNAIGRGNKLLFCGNGGSACDAMHIAGEFVGRFVEDRQALPAIALTADSGILTAVANDYAYDQVFSRQIEAIGRPGDVLMALSTSGRSPNVLRALAAAKAKGLYSVLMTGEKYQGGPAAPADLILVVPSVITAHVQEAQMVGLHALASLMESQLSTI